MRNVSHTLPVSAEANSSDSPHTFLDPLDRQSLELSGLTAKTVAAMGCYTADCSTIEDRTGVRVVSAGYAIPYVGILDQTGQEYTRWRLRNPKDGQRYVGGRGEDTHAYVPPGFHELPEADLLIITEGEKKAAKAVQEGIACIAIQGVWTWPASGSRAAEKERGEDVTPDTEPCAEILSTTAKYRSVLVLGDSDLLAKPQALSGLKMLARALRKRNVRAMVACCPPGRDQQDSDGLTKVGLDDWLCSEGAAKVKRALATLFGIELVCFDSSEAAFAEWFADAYRERLAVNPSSGWLYWADTHWTADGPEAGERHKMIATFASQLRVVSDEISSLSGKLRSQWRGVSNDKLPTELKSWLLPMSDACNYLSKAIARLRTQRGIRNTLEICQPHLRIREGEWDRNPYLLAAQNGTVDLRTGELHPAQPSDRITRCAGTSYEPAASIRVWLEFLERVQRDPIAQISLQCAMGYSASGVTGEQVVWFHYGCGANGKSTFHGIAAEALGSYAKTAGISLIENKGDNREQDYELASLRGVRMVNISETRQTTALDMSMIKRLTAEESVSARHMYGHPFTFRPICKLHLSTNHLPRVTDNTYGAWRRLRFFDWQETILTHEQDNGLAERLRSELPGILA